MRARCHPTHLARCGGNLSFYFPFKQWFLASHNRTYVSVLPVLNSSAESVVVVPFCFSSAVLPDYSVLFFFDSINYSDKKMLILRTEFCPSSPLQRSLRSSSR